MEVNLFILILRLFPELKMDSSQLSLPSTDSEESSDICKQNSRQPWQNEPERKDSNKIWYCRHCPWNHNVKTNFRKHLKKHGIDATTKPSLVQVLTSLQIEAAEQRNEEASVRFKDLLLRLIARHALPFSIVSWPEFRTLLQFLEPKAQNWCPTSGTCIANWIGDTWQNCKFKLASDLQTSRTKVHLSLDIWTSSNNFSFLGIVAHYIPKDQIQTSKALLGLREVYKHSGAEQFQTLYPLLIEYGIDRRGKLGFLIGDNAGSNDTLAREIETWFKVNEVDYPWEETTQRTRCMGHIINLIAQGFLFKKIKGPQDIADDEATISGTDLSTQSSELASLEPSSVVGMGVLGKVHNIIVHIRSPQRTFEFVKLAGRRIPLDNETRWNSWFNMLQACIDKEKELDFYMKTYQKDLKTSILKPTDWTILKEIYEILKFFEDSTQKNQGDYHNISDSIMTLFNLWSQLRAQLEKKNRIPKPTPEDRDLISRLKAGNTALMKWWNYLFEHPCYLVAHILNPNYRNEYTEIVCSQFNKDSELVLQRAKDFWKEWSKREHYQSINEAMFPYQGETENTRKRRQTAQILNNLREEKSIADQARRIHGVSVQVQIDEFSHYLSQPALDIKKPLAWWFESTQQQQYPKLSKLAIELLSIPAMSAEVERVFSGARRTISWDRSRLRPEKIEEVECAKHYFKNQLKDGKEEFRMAFD